MPTVKLQNGKVILKDGKVSCSCCAVEPDCCMYPADGLGDTYEAADLPDELNIKWQEMVDDELTDIFVGSISKSGSGYVNGTVSLTIINGKWTLKDTSTDPETVRAIGNCLITGDGNYTPGDDTVEDQFEDTYDVTTPTGSGTVARVSLCRWEGETTDGCALILTYGPNEVFDGCCKWSLQWDNYDSLFGCGDGEAGLKEDPQSSPEGTYIDPISESEATVSAP
jgi:hypothetical protein